MAVGATLIYMILYGAFSAGTELSGGFGSVICSLLVLLIGIPLEWGYSIMFLPLVRQEGKLDLGMLFDGFKDYGRILLTLLLMSVYVFLWALLLLVPGFIKAYSYSMTPYILKELQEHDRIQRLAPVLLRPKEDIRERPRAQTRTDHRLKPYRV